MGMDLYFRALNNLLILFDQMRKAEDTNELGALFRKGADFQIYILFITVSSFDMVSPMGIASLNW